jgi:hypothetical protein
MLLYYYTELNLVAMWYYNDKMELMLWVEELDSGGRTMNNLAVHRDLESRRVARSLEAEGWCELLYDSGDA